MRKRLSGMVRFTRQLAAAIIILLLFPVHLPGLDPTKPTAQYLVDQWGISEGIPSNTIHSITQTGDGYLWIATTKGLLRFDGMKFSTIRFVEGTAVASLENTIPDTLFVDREGTLWIGGSGALTSYRYSTGRFRTFTAADGLSWDRIRHIKDDMKGNLWISFFASYVNRFANEKFSVFNASHGLESSKINAVVEVRNGNLLFGSRENGVYIYNNEKFLKYPIPGLGNVQIISMVEDRDGDLWIGTNNGLLRVNENGARQYTTSDGLSDNYITRMMEDGDRNFWVGTLKGLNRLKKNQDGAIRFESLLESFLITCLFEDRERSLWVGTYNSGIKRLRDGKFISYAPLEAYQQEILQSLFEDSRGDTWIGTLDGKLFRCRGSDFIERLEPPELSGTAIASIAEDAEGNLWLGTNGNGIFLCQLEKNRTLTRFTTRDGLADNLVTSISGDSRGNLWCCTFGGVSVIRRGNGVHPVIESFNSRDGLSGKVVNNVSEDKTQNIWIAADKGITVLKDGKIAKANTTYYLQGVSVTCIHEDLSAPGAAGRVFWVATHGEGLKRLKLPGGAAADFTTTSYTTSYGMTTDFIYQFFEDRRENFWLMSDSGILRVGKDELNRFAAGGAAEINCTSFGLSDGMKSLEFNNEFSRNSALKSRNGEFWFITKKGISIVNPDRIQIDKIPPPVVIEAVFFNRQPVPLHTLKQENTNFFKGITDLQFHFTAPTFLYPGKIKFKYRLEGFDRDWISLAPGKERAARYDNLGPGLYTFRVTAGNSEGVWNRTGDAAVFTLKPFFYQTLLFKAAVFLLFILLAAAVFYIVKNRPFENREKYKGSPLDPHIAEECTQKLKRLMEIKKIYCDPAISLHSLAEKLSVSPHVLSQVLNEKLNRAFPDFINSYRIEEAKRILRETGGEQKIATVALDVGFNTLAVFYTAFKKFTHMTPAQYKKEAGTQE